LGATEEIREEACEEGEGGLGSLQEENGQEHQKEEGLGQEGLGFRQEEDRKGHQEDQEEDQEGLRHRSGRLW